MTASQYITEEIGKVVALMREEGSEVPYYMYGHPRELNSRLLAKDRKKDLKYKKYPLVALRLNVPGVRRGNIWDYRINLAFITYTKEDLNAEQRMAQVIYPVLFPLYNLFLEKVKSSGLFTFTNDESNEIPRHEPTVKPYWGTEQDNDHVKSIFQDHLDAIEIENLELSQRVKIC